MCITGRAAKSCVSTRRNPDKGWKPHTRERRGETEKQDPILMRLFEPYIPLCLKLLLPLNYLVTCDNIHILHFSMYVTVDSLLQ